jgi:hypothetical protein
VKHGLESDEVTFKKSLEMQGVRRRFSLSRVCPRRSTLCRPLQIAEDDDHLEAQDGLAFDQQELEQVRSTGRLCARVCECT